MDQTYKAKWSKQKREECKKNGICVDCYKRIAIHGKTKCEKCAERNTQSLHKREELRESSGKCVRCGQESKTRYCNKCKDDSRNNSRKIIKIRTSNNLCLRCGSPKPCDCAAKLRNEKKRQGICVSCCVNANNGNGNYCDICVFKNIAQNNLKDRSRWRDLQLLFEKQDGICPYSGIKLILGVNASVDHIVSKAKGGTNNCDNLQWVHLWINLMKRDMDKEQFVCDFQIFTEACHKQFFPKDLTAESKLRILQMLFVTTSEFGNAKI